MTATSQIRITHIDRSKGSEQLVLYGKHTNIEVRTMTSILALWASVSSSAKWKEYTLVARLLRNLKISCAKEPGITFLPGEQFLSVKDE